ncbi:hypothetical protein BGY98DRAFT_976625, partial [Russula aff. rugulosa BPL654]
YWKHRGWHAPTSSPHDQIRNDPGRVFGLEPMAVVFSLPWALLMWSMATFFIALLLFCFTISNKATRISVIAMSIMVVILIVWSIGALEYKLAREVSQKASPRSDAHAETYSDV